MSISRQQLVEAHLEHAVRIPEYDLHDVAKEIYDAVDASPGHKVIIGNLQARIEHRSGRRAVHWRHELEKVAGHVYAENVLAATPPGEDRSFLVIEELPS